MSGFDLALPTGDTDTDRFARELAILRGPEITAQDGTLVAAHLRAHGELLANAREALQRAVGQAHPGSASDLLDELEEQHGLSPGDGLTTTQRRARLLAKVRARREGTENALLATVHALEPTATIQGFAWSSVTAWPRATHRVAVVVPSATWANAATRESIRAAVEQQKPAHVEVHVTVTVGFRYDESLLDRDLLSV